MVSAGNRLSPQSLSCCIDVEMVRRKKGEGAKKPRFSFMAQEKARNKVVMATGFIKPPKIPQRDISVKKRT